LAFDCMSSFHKPNLAASRPCAGAKAPGFPAHVTGLEPGASTKPRL
jgi:hypothetical protein